MAKITKLKPEDWFHDPDLPFHASRCGIQKSFAPHGHEGFFEFFLLVKGRLYHSIDRDERVIEEGDIVLLNPEHEHAYRLIPEQPAQSLQAIFMPSFLEVDPGFLRKEKSFTEMIFMLPFYDTGCTVFRLSGKTRLKVQTLLEELIEEYELKQVGYGTAIRAKLTDLLVTVARAYEKEKEKNPEIKKSLSGTAEAILDSMSYIEDHFTEDLILEEVAEKTAGVTREYFSKVFHNITGTTFTKYIAGLRVGKAKELLKNTDDKVINVCYESGFNDLSHFNRTFKKLAGVTPSSYRKSNQ